MSANGRRVLRGRGGRAPQAAHQYPRPRAAVFNQWEAIGGDMIESRRNLLAPIGQGQPGLHAVQTRAVAA